jgi:hypothetical protein
MADQLKTLLREYQLALMMEQRFVLKVKAHQVKLAPAIYSFSYM